MLVLKEKEMYIIQKVADDGERIVHPPNVQLGGLLIYLYLKWALIDKWNE